MYIACIVIWTLRIEIVASGSFMFSVIAQTAEPFREQAEEYLYGPQIYHICWNARQGFYLKSGT
jgi:hypothetical protein